MAPQHEETKKKVVAITDYNFTNLNPEKEILFPLGVKLIESQCKTEEEVIELCKDAEAILTQWAPIKAKAIENIKRCKLIVRYGIGVDNVDIKTARKYNMDVVNIPDYCVDEVAEHTITLILSSIRKICYVNSQVKNGIWKIDYLKPIFACNELTLGLIGFGRIARAVAKRAEVFGFRLLSYDPYVKEGIFKDFNVKKVSFDELLNISDIISIHVPLTDETRYLINREVLKKVKRRTIIVNVSRGAIIDEKALAETIEGKRVAGAALDVLEKEPIDTSNPLIKFDNVIITNHCASYSEKSIRRLQYSAAEEVARFIRGEKPLNIIN